MKILLTFMILQSITADSFSFNISNFKSEANDIIYDGDAQVVNGSIELITNFNVGYRVGQASYAKSILLWNSSSQKSSDFITHFSFTIDKSNQTPFADGFAFFIAPLDYEFPRTNSSGGYLGLFNSTITRNKIVFVEFDTFRNAQWDPPFAHVGINNGTLNSANYVRWTVDAGESADAWIAYNSTTKNLSVFWTYEKDVVYMGNSTVSYIIDLMKILPEQVKIGFSGSTGVYFQQNLIHSWRFTSQNTELSVANIPNTKRKKGMMSKIGVGAGVIGVSLVILVIGIGSFVVRRRRIKNNTSRNKREASSINDDLERGALPRIFGYEELEKATNGFADHMKLGSGGSGQVYRGKLNDIGRVVAVKKISTEFAHSERVFINEVKIISRVIHRNLVQFIGWCHDRGNFLLVYDYMPNGSLDTHLFGNRSEITLPWKIRYKTAIDIASALHYLHEDAEQCVLHRDIKSANVLLDADFSAKLGDFGVAKLVDTRLKTQKTNIVGTYGYLAPEYAYGGKASKESDIFSFGIVALELAYGRRTYFDGEDHTALAKGIWQHYLAGNILEAADERLRSDFDKDEMECLLKVGLLCAHPKDKERPRAGEVIKILKFEVPVPDLPHDAHDATIPLLHRASSSLENDGTVAVMTTSSIHLGR
ncbi:L-type lectin-domain containing receptor kinase IX.1-like [Mercurialis annua]|uniref:L-type lectin-domain containing receptor kinase IX.1-like n=1 Tax=Mercurialis annua TaxID=3986 RepID=UPI00216084DB|nr:L-type lectin-domain containing receptor kinase IX.1-like [Mercurialis annua]